jgi:hypothetical protein
MDELPSKVDVVCELAKFLAKIYRLICLAMIVYAIGPWGAVGIGIVLFLLALYTGPNESRCYSAEQETISNEAGSAWIC